MKIKFTHTNIIAKDWKKISRFYQEVFGCVPVPTERDMRGDWIDRMTGIRGAQIRGEHLRLPGYQDKLPTLEISYWKEPNTIMYNSIVFSTRKAEF